eukprot:909760-Prorocentrum_minimum.AAC.1
MSTAHRSRTAVDAVGVVTGVLERLYVNCTGVTLLVLSLVCWNGSRSNAYRGRTAIDAVGVVTGVLERLHVNCAQGLTTAYRGRTAVDAVGVGVLEQLQLSGYQTRGGVM